MSIRKISHYGSLCCGLLLSAALSAETISLQSSQIQALGIESLVANAGENPRATRLPARVLVPNEQMRLVAAPVGGMVEMLAVAPGERVRRGQVVAHLASPQALELQRDAMQSGSHAALQKQNLQRDEQLFAEGLIAESRLQATRATAAQAAAQASQQRQVLGLAGATQGKLGGPLALTATIDGVVLEQGVQLGQRVEASALIYRIAKLSPLWLEIQSPLELASRLREGMPVKVANSEVQGKLISVGRAVDPASQTVLLRALVRQGAETLTPGQVVEIDLGNAYVKGLSLPLAAVVRHDGKTFAFVQQTGDGQVIRFDVRPVRVLSQGGDGVIVEGIQAGERVVVKGASGMKAMLAGIGKE